MTAFQTTVKTLWVHTDAGVKVRFLFFSLTLLLSLFSFFPGNAVFSPKSASTPVPSAAQSQINQPYYSHSFPSVTHMLAN